MSIVTTFYPSLDGFTIKEGNATWAAARSQTDGSGGSVAEYNLVDALRCTQVSSSDWRLGRVFLLFNTSVISSKANIISATIRITQAGHEGVTNRSIGITQSYPQSNSVIVGSDHPRVYDTLLSDYQSVTSSVPSTKTFTLTAAGRATITREGISKFALRDSKDITNTPPIVEQYGAGIYFNEYSTVAYRPLLTVTYQEPIITCFML